MTKLSAIVITKNESHNIAECLLSLSFADEIIVFDSSSTDNTVEIARQFTQHVIVTPDWPGDGPQKNRALEIATGNWVICLDADERVPEQLASEIKAAIATTQHDAFDIPYQSTYCGKLIKFGDWRKESHVRLFRKGKAGFTTDIVHCHLKVQGSIGKLKKKLIHHPFPNFAALLHKMNDYSSQSAKIYFSRGRRASFWTAVSHGAWTFFRGYILKLGFLDGEAGFMLAASNAHGTYYRYLKLMQLCQAH
jgi:glycosyltransferase involved in cell wall biosynthesis